MDYKRFLDKSQSLVVPVVDGVAWLRDRSLRSQAAPGWWRLTVRGRVTETVAPATADEVASALAGLPVVRGHVIASEHGLALVHGGAACHPVELSPSGEEPPLLAPVRARRWPIGELLLWDGLDWEGETEETARRAIEEGRGLGDVKGVSSALRAAFAFAAARLASRALGIEAAPAELLRWVGNIAERGGPAAEEALRSLARERAEWAARQATRAQVVRALAAAVAAPPPAQAEQLDARVESALRNTGARALAGARRMGDGLVEVRWLFAGQRFISIVEERGLRVVDSGVCLAERDDLVTLESLPGVIGEAIREGALVITRRDRD